MNILPDDLLAAANAFLRGHVEVHDWLRARCADTAHQLEGTFHYYVEAEPAQPGSLWEERARSFAFYQSFVDHSLEAAGRGVVRFLVEHSVRIELLPARGVEVPHVKLRYIWRVLDAFDLALFNAKSEQRFQEASRSRITQRTHCFGQGYLATGSVPVLTDVKQLDAWFAETVSKHLAIWQQTPFVEQLGKLEDVVRVGPGTPMLNRLHPSQVFPVSKEMLEKPASVQACKALGGTIEAYVNTLGFDLGECTQQMVTGSFGNARSEAFLQRTMPLREQGSDVGQVQCWIALQWSEELQQLTLFAGGCVVLGNKRVKQDVTGPCLALSQVNSHDQTRLRKWLESFDAADSGYGAQWARLAHDSLAQLVP